MSHRVPSGRWLTVIVVIALVAGHGVLLRAIPELPLPAIVLALTIAAIVLLHLGIRRSGFKRRQ